MKPCFHITPSTSSRTSHRGLLERLGRGSSDAAGTYVLQVVSLGLGFLSQLIVARLVGLSGYGAYAYALAWSGMVVRPALLGLDRILIRELAHYRQLEAFALMRGLLRRAEQIAWIGSGVFTAIVAAVALPISSQTMRTTVAVGLLTIPLATVGRVRLAALQGLKQSSLGQLTQSVGRTVYFIAFLGAAVAVAGTVHLRPEVAVGMQALAFGAAVVSGSAVLRVIMPREVMRSVPQFEGQRWLRSVPQLTVLTLFSAANSQIGVVMLGAMGTPTNTGLFNAALRSAVLVSLGMTALEQVIAPRVAVLYQSGDRTGIERLLGKGTHFASALAVPPALFLTLVGPWFLGLFGHGFRQGGTALTILVAGQVFNAATGAIGVVLVMTTHERSATRAMFSGTAINIALCALLIPIWGATGAATATSVSLVLINVMFMVAVVRKLHVRPTLFGIRLPASVA